MVAEAMNINIAEIFDDIMSDYKEVINIIERPQRSRIFRNRVHHFQIWDECEFLNI